jgi:hypothetical protein
MPVGFQLGARFKVVEELTIKDYCHTPVFVGDRLLAVRQADDAESARSQRQTRALKVAFFVGAAVKNRLRHLFDDPIL